MKSILLTHVPLQVITSLRYHEEAPKHFVGSGEKRGNIMKTRALILTLFLIFIAAMLVTGCQGTDNQTVPGLLPDADAAEFEGFPDDPILDANHWQEEFPDQVRTFIANEEREQKRSYLKEYPWLATVYEGSGFAKQYDSARTHPFALIDISETSRTKDAGLSTCWACKTAQYPLMEAEGASKLYDTPFDDLREAMTETITCFDCHKNAPGLGRKGGTLAYSGGFLGSIRWHFNSAFPEARTGDATCGQCHVEYHFTPQHAVKLPPELTDPTAIYEYYQSIEYVDYTNPRTGTKQLKVQHPEYQTCFGTLHDKKDLTCVSCHMERATNNIGQYSNHTITSPSKSEVIRSSQCIWCHPQDRGVNLIKETRNRIWPQVVAVGERLAAFCDAFATALDAGEVNDADTSKLRALHREAQWYWDWVFAENSQGVHNPAQAQACIDKANELLDQAETLLD